MASAELTTDQNFWEILVFLTYFSFDQLLFFLKLCSLKFKCMSMCKLSGTEYSFGNGSPNIIKTLLSFSMNKQTLEIQQRNYHNRSLRKSEYSLWTSSNKFQITKINFSIISRHVRLASPVLNQSKLILEQIHLTVTNGGSLLKFLPYYCQSSTTGELYNLILPPFAS